LRKTFLIKVGSNNSHCQIFEFGYIFKFYSDDYEPVHVHVIKDGKEAKYNICPEVTQVYNHGYKKHEISIIEGIIEENVEVIIDRWNSFLTKRKLWSNKE